MSGDTLVVEAALGGHEVAVKVRLLWVACPDSTDNAHGKEKKEDEDAAAFLRELLPEGSRISLWGPRKKLEMDSHDRVLASARRGTVVHHHAPEDRPDLPSVWMPQVEPVTIQEQLIEAGRSVYWRRDGEAPEPLHSKLEAAQKAAQEARRGIWGSNPTWAEDKANERTAPK